MTLPQEKQRIGMIIVTSILIGIESLVNVVEREAVLQSFGTNRVSVVRSVREKSL